MATTTDINSLTPGTIVRTICFYDFLEPAKQVEGPVPHSDQGILAEEDRLGSVSGFRELGKDNAGHARVDEHPDDALHAHHHDGDRALGSSGSAAVTRNWVLLG